MIKIGICDDEESEIKHIYKLSQKVLDEQRFDYIIHTFGNGKDLLDSKDEFDIIFLDVQLGGINGIDVGKQLYKQRGTNIIYISNYTQYCIEAINRVHAFAYLVKPIKEANLKEQILALIECRKKLEIDERINFEILFIEYDLIKKVFMEFKVYDIYYFEFVSRKIKIKLRQQEYYFIGKLKDVEQHMENYNFARCHNSYIVNIKHIARVCKLEVVLDNNERIPIAQRRASEFRKKVNSSLHKFNSFIGEVYE